jgi:uroporphyrinogen decarboxylase
MTPRQRILAALNHQRPDRTPADGWFHGEVVDMLKRHFATDDWWTVRRELGIDGWVDLAPCVAPAEFQSRATSPPGDDPGPEAVWLDARTYEDPWAARFQLGVGGRYRRWLSGPLQQAKTVDDVLACRFPSARDIVEPDGYARQVADRQAEQCFVSGEIENPFKRYWHLRGFENALADYLADPELLEAAYDRLFALGTELALRIARAGADMVKVVGDVAMQDRIMMGPRRWRQYDKPRWARLIDACRAERPELVFFFHSDGKLTDLVDDLVDVGFTVINPIQPECMDPVEVKRRWGKRITLHGGISIQRTLPFGSADDVRREVEELIAQCGADGGLIVMPSNDIQPDTPLRNILACYQAVREYRFPG